MKREQFILNNKKGLSSRACTTLVTEANKYKADSFICHNDECANLKSIMNVLALVIRDRDTFILQVDGEDEEIAYEALLKTLSSLELI